MWSRRRAVVVLAIFAGVTSVSTVRAASAPAADDTVAIVGGQPVHEDELLGAAAPQLRQLRTREYEIKRAALDQIIDQRLLDAEAKKRGISSAQLLREIDSAVAEPTDSEVQSYYRAQNERIKRPYDEVKTQLRDALRTARVQQARDAHMKTLRASAGVKVLLPPPRVSVAVDPARVRGSAHAPVTIVEFSDFECPYCREAESTVKEVLRKYDQRVRLAYRDFPLSIHPHAQGAAEASRCAAVQGKFWEYHDALFTPGAVLDAAALKEHVRRVGLDERTFTSCVESRRFRTAVANDEREGLAAGVGGTPAFFINGVLLTGAQPLAAFERVIDEELARAGSGDGARTTK